MLLTRVFFRAFLRTDFGERVAVVGSSPALGNWQVEHCHELTTNEDVFPSWFSKEPVYLPLKKPVAYKYVVLDERGDIVRWEEKEGNRELVPTGLEMTVEDDGGLFREQMTTRGDKGVEGDDDVSVTAQDKEETEARNRVLAIQEEEPQIDENDTLILCALDLPIRVARVKPLQTTTTPTASGGGTAAAGAGGGHPAGSSAVGRALTPTAWSPPVIVNVEKDWTAPTLPAQGSRPGHAGGIDDGGGAAAAAVQSGGVSSAAHKDTVVSSAGAASVSAERHDSLDRNSSCVDGGGNSRIESPSKSSSSSSSSSSSKLRETSDSGRRRKHNEDGVDMAQISFAAGAGEKENQQKQQQPHNGSSSSSNRCRHSDTVAPVTVASIRETQSLQDPLEPASGEKLTAATHPPLPPPAQAVIAAASSLYHGTSASSASLPCTTSCSSVHGEEDVHSTSSTSRAGLPTSFSAGALDRSSTNSSRSSSSVAGARGGERSSRGKFEILPSKNALLPSLYRLRYKTRQPVLFIGWPGIDVENPIEQQELTDFLRRFDCVPIFPEKKEFHQYLTFCHRFLWPLFHNVVILDSKTQEPFDSELWSCYQSVNKLWADAVVRHAHETDMIWVHDFHLMLAPLYISRKVRKANIGFFLHIPFPSSEIFRCLPCREDILRGMLCADLIGFHLFEYARHFLVACKRLLGLEHHFCRGGILSIEYAGRSVSIRIGHVHIQYEDIRQKIEASASVEKMANDIRQKYEGKFIFVAVDRCEKLAGLLLKVRAFRKFLQTYPYARGRVVLIQYAYPTISYAEETESMKADLIELVDKVNAEFYYSSTEKGEDLQLQQQAAVETSNEETDSHGCLHIDLRVQPVGWEEKCSVFLAGDCLLDTSIRDGLNLNPFEFICCHKDHVTGIILSEFTGCSRALASAIRVNPWKIEAVADAMDRIINLPVEEQRDRFLRDQDYLAHNSTQKWAEENIRDIRRAKKPDDFVYMSWGLGNTFRVLGMDSNFRFLETNAVLQAYKTAKHRVFFFDCEGTLAPDRRRLPFSGGENLFAEGRAPSTHVKNCLNTLLKDPKNVVVILSGRNRHLLEEWFELVKGIGLCAEHGFYFRVYQITGDQWHCMSRQRDFTWKQVALELMLQYVKRTQGSFIENKGSALVFQYRDADPDFGSMQAKDLSNYLNELLFGYPVSVVSGKGYVEVKLRGVNKGHAVEKVLRKLTTIHGDVDFILCVGDDRSDEDMFAVINAMTEDGDQLSLPEGSGAGSSGLYRHLQSKDRICRRNSVSSDDATSQQRPGSTPTTRKDNSTNAFANQATKVPFSAASSAAGLSSTGASVAITFSSASTAASSCGVVAGSASAPKRKVSSHFFTCTVGKKPSNARYYLNDTEDVSDLLEVLRQYAEKEQQPAHNSKDTNAAPAAAAAAAAGSLAGNVAVQLRKGSETAGSLAGLWMRSALASAGAATITGQTSLRSSSNSGNSKCLVGAAYESQDDAADGNGLPS